MFTPQFICTFSEPLPEWLALIARAIVKKKKEKYTFGFMGSRNMGIHQNLDSTFWHDVNITPTGGDLRVEGAACFC